MWGKNKDLDEIESADRKSQRELGSGVAALVLLSIPGEAAEPMYGYQIAKRVDGQAEDAPADAEEHFRHPHRDVGLLHRPAADGACL